MIWRQLPRSGCIRTSAVRPAERSTQLEPRGTYHHPLARLRGDESGKVPGGPCSSLLMSSFYSVKMHIPKSRRTSRESGSDSRSRSPLSIRALRFARGERIRRVTKIVSKPVSFFPAQSRPLARLVQDDGSRKLLPTNGSVVERALAADRRMEIFI